MMSRTGQFAAYWLLFIVLSAPLPKIVLAQTNAAPLFQDDDRLAEYSAQNAASLVTSSLITGKPVVYLGESHPDTSPKQFLASNISLFKEHGVTHLGLEMIRADKQRLLDDFQRGTVPEHTLLDYLAEDWGWLPEQYMTVISSAKASGIKVVALDGRTTSESLEIDFRDQRMARTISNIVRENPKNRILVLIGSAHVNALSQDEAVEHQPSLLLKNYGIDSAVYKIEPLNRIFTSYQPRPGAPPSAFDPNSPNWIRKRRYLESDSILRKAFAIRDLPTTNTFLPTPRSLSGFDGILFIDSYNIDTDELLN